MKNRLSDPFGDLCSRGPVDEVVEVSLLLPGWQASALERAAHDRGLTAAEMVRSLLRDFLAEQGLGVAAEGPLALAAHHH
jgi:hypothetical protein